MTLWQRIKNWCRNWFGFGKKRQKGIDIPNIKGVNMRDSTTFRGQQVGRSQRSGSSFVDIPPVYGASREQPNYTGRGEVSSRGLVSTTTRRSDEVLDVVTTLLVVDAATDLFTPSAQPVQDSHAERLASEQAYAARHTEAARHSDNSSTTRMDDTRSSSFDDTPRSSGDGDSGSGSSSWDSSDSSSWSD